MKDAVATMGDLLPEETSGRDAVHVAVFSACATVALYPSQRVSRVREVGADTLVSPDGVPIAIVDPFLTAPVPPGVRFWAYLLPRTITGLSHRWTHPAFEEVAAATYAAPADKLASERWLKDWLNGGYDNGDDEYYEILLSNLNGVADGKSGSDEYLTIYGEERRGDIPAEFWHHAEIVIGRPMPSRRPLYFICSC